jgi:P-type Ca2+ transporter type 2C
LQAIRDSPYSMRRAAYHAPVNEQDRVVGLSSTAAAARLKLDGYNELPAPDRRGFLRILGEVMRQPMFALLIGGGLVYLLLGDRLEALLLLLFASLSVTITIVQESRSERVLEALRNLASPRALVVRDGKRVQVAGREVVRDDVLVIAEGDRVAADATLVLSNDLRQTTAASEVNQVTCRVKPPAASRR